MADEERVQKIRAQCLSLPDAALFKLMRGMSVRGKLIPKDKRPDLYKRVAEEVLFDRPHTFALLCKGIVVERYRPSCQKMLHAFLLYRGITEECFDVLGTTEDPHIVLGITEALRQFPDEVVEHMVQTYLRRLPP